jgi:hypothetical protein
MQDNGVPKCSIMVWLNVGDRFAAVGLVEPDNHGAEKP